MRFVNYLVAALQRVDGTLGQSVLDLLQMPQLAEPSILMTTLLNDVARRPFPILIVLDDLHLITNATIHDQLAFLLTNCPPNQALGITLDADEITALEQRTEGWIAGLQLAAVALQMHVDNQSAFHDQQHANVHAFVESFTGSNLFVIPLDTTNQWMRYHHLFRSLLQHYLNQRLGKDVANECRIRASNWFAAQGLWDDAIETALAAQSFDLAADLIEQLSDDFFATGEMATFMRWLKALPDEIVRSRVYLCLRYARLLFLVYGQNEAESYLKSARLCSRPIQSQAL